MRDLSADTRRLEELNEALWNINAEAMDILARGDDRAEIVLSQLGTVSQTFRDYLPHARDQATSAADQRGATQEWLRKRYAGPQR